MQEAESRTAGRSPLLCSRGADNWRRGPVLAQVDFQPVIVSWSEMIDSDVVGAVPMASSYTPEKWMSITDCVCHCPWDYLGRMIQSGDRLL